MTSDQLAVITDIIGRAPEWVRQDLLAKEPSHRQRAEEALAAMIAAALSREVDATDGAATAPACL